MPAAAGWGAAQGQVSPGGKSFPFRSRFSLQTLWAQLHRQLSPSGASLLPYCSPCSLPAWLPPPCLLTIASLMLSNCRTYCLCSAAPALGLRGPRKRQATKQGQSTEKGQGWEKKAGTQDRCISAVLGQVCAWLLSPWGCKGQGSPCLGKPHPEHSAPRTWGTNFISAYCPLTTSLSCSWEVCPYLAALAIPVFVWWYKIYPGTKFPFLDNTLKRGALLQMLQRLIERKNAHKCMGKKKGVEWSEIHTHRNPNTSNPNGRTTRTGKAC